MITFNHTAQYNGNALCFWFEATVQLPASSGLLALTLRNKQAAAVAPNVRVLRIVNGS